MAERGWPWGARFKQKREKKESCEEGNERRAAEGGREREAVGGSRESGGSVVDTVDG